ncbi:hypothetical protein L218DRAFT_950952 [Marasmius fiardii PR-910]|nr:hypothetical protein L218DRAFT_950952 [Marasmius fiardii PR-910]
MFDNGMQGTLQDGGALDQGTLGPVSDGTGDGAPQLKYLINFLLENVGAFPRWARRRLRNRRLWKEMTYSGNTPGAGASTSPIPKAGSSLSTTRAAAVDLLNKLGIQEDDLQENGWDLRISVLIPATNVDGVISLVTRGENGLPASLMIRKVNVLLLEPKTSLILDAMNRKCLQTTNTSNNSSAAVTPALPPRTIATKRPRGKVFDEITPRNALVGGSMTMEKKTHPEEPRKVSDAWWKAVEQSKASEYKCYVGLAAAKAAATSADPG